MKQYHATTLSTWINTWLESKDYLSFVESLPSALVNGVRSGTIKAWCGIEHILGKKPDP